MPPMQPSQLLNPCASSLIPFLQNLRAVLHAKFHLLMQRTLGVGDMPISFNSDSHARRDRLLLSFHAAARTLDALCALERQSMADWLGGALVCGWASFPAVTDTCCSASGHFIARRSIRRLPDRYMRSADLAKKLKDHPYSQAAFLAGQLGQVRPQKTVDAPAQAHAQAGEAQAGEVQAPAPEVPGR